MIPLTRGTRLVEFSGQKVEQQLPGFKGRETGSYCLLGRVSIEDDEVLEMDHGDGCITVSILSGTELYN